MSDTELFELQLFNDWREAKKGRFEIEESKPTRSRPGLGGYVVAPALLFGLLTALIIGGVLTALAVMMSFVTVTATQYFPEIILGSSIAFGSSIMFFAAVLLIEDWRDLQVEYTKRVYIGVPEVTERARVMVATGEGKRGVSRVTWQNGGLDELSRRCHNDYGEWTAGSNISRPLFENPPLFANVTQNYALMLQDFFDWGWIDKPEIGARWISKGKAYLREILRIV